MRKLYSFIIFGLVLSHLSAQQFTYGGSVLMSGNPQLSAISHQGGQEATDNLMESPQIRVYPNPAGEQVQLTVNDKMVGNTFRIYSLLGSEMISRSIENSRESVDVSQLSQGLYLYNIIDKNNKTVLTGKFNKQ